MSDTTDAGALSPEEIEAERAEALPDREALSVMGGNLVAPAGADGFSDMPPADGNAASQPQPEPQPYPADPDPQPYPAQPDGIQPL